MVSLLRGLQVSSIITNFVIALLGLVVVLVGVATLHEEKQYFTITDGRTELHRIPYSLILVGICVVCLAVLGIVGSITTRMIGGRILLGVYTFVLSLIIFSEVAAGGSALRARTTFEKTFVESSFEYLRNRYQNNSKTWDEFQQKYKCCGAVNYTSYIECGYAVPESCCVNPGSAECETARNDTIDTDTIGEAFYAQGCPDAVVASLQRNYVVIAIVMLLFGFAQCFSVVLGCVLAAVSSKEDNVNLKRHVTPHRYEPLPTAVKT